MRFVLIAACLLLGCRTSSGDPVQTAAGRVDVAVEKSAAASGDAGPTELRVRYNPAPCECPPYEVFAYGRWARSFIDGESPTIAALQNADALAVATLVGTVADNPRVADNGVMYPVVRLQ